MVYVDSELRKNKKLHITKFSVLALSPTVSESPADFPPVWETIWHRRRLSGSLLFVMATMNEAHIHRKLGLELQETPRQSATVTESLPDRLSKSRRLQALSRVRQRS
ncbi:hypothetical protein DPMN_102458 [Dreissena polymorpha]|uniref:Uncharacterized protein n=1 Tax=Dreissena polymorpha TaxID=45954 RepID=A0A9D4LJ35_DREPO|nr:hypothetical protein DPMN_102458 [Dreissena polymorpha]